MLRRGYGRRSDLERAVTTLAQIELEPPRRPPPDDFRHNDWLGQFEIPFGEWADQMIDWIDTNVGDKDSATIPLIRWIAKPVDVLLELVVDDVFKGVSWIWVVLAIGLLGWRLRGVLVGTMSALGLTACGLLGSGYWSETAHTLGVMTVTLSLCAVIGIPIGIACARSDPIWRVMRLVLDAMQVVHPFVYLLPFLFLFGLGDTGATLVILIYSMPSLIRITNLGVRELPEPVIEAGRAFGANRWQMARDIYIPLARPAIMTGINQTLILALSMHAIAALLGGGGLGRLLFRGITSVGMPQVISSGVAFVIVALVLDRLTQPRPPQLAKFIDGTVPTPLSERESSWATATGAAGMALVLATIFMPWSLNGARVSAHARLADLAIQQSSFDGIDARGGSWFGVIVAMCGALLILIVLANIGRSETKTRWIAPDGAFAISLAALATALAFLLLPTANGAAGSYGAGAYVAAVAAAVAVLASWMWVINAPFTRRSAVGGQRWRMIVATSAVVLLVIGGFSGWTFDERDELIITAEQQAELDRLIELTRDPATSAKAATDFQVLMAQLSFVEPVVLNGFTTKGTGLGWIVLTNGALSLLAIAASTRATTFDRDRAWTALGMAFGLSVTAVALAWIVSVMRVHDPKIVSGVGAFMAVAAGSMLAAANHRVLADQHRIRIEIPQG